MIRRLFSLVWAVAGRSKKIQDLVAIVWPAARGTAVVVATPAAPVASPVVASVVVPVEQVVEAVAAGAALPAATEPVIEEVVADADVAAEEAPQAVEVAPAPAPAALDEDVPSLRPLGSKESMDGSVWVPRILWALEFAKLRGLGPQSASDISRVLGEHSGLNVPSPNVARAFRDRKQQGASYWKEVEGQKYEISRAGSAALRRQLRSQDN